MSETPRIHEPVAGQTMLEQVAEPLLRAHAALRAEYASPHGELLKAVREDEVCRRLMTIPGVGAVVAMAFRSAIDQSKRFAKSKAVGAHFGLTPKKYQSGEAWALWVASRQGMKKAEVALARKLAVVMHRMWVDGTSFR